MDDLISRQALLREYQNVCNGVACILCPFLMENKCCALEQWIENFAPIQSNTSQRVGSVGDTISRQAAIGAIDAIFPADPMKTEYAQGIACGAALAKIYIEQLPSAQPERKAGKWEQVQVNCLADMDEDIKESMSIASMFCPSCKRYHNEVYLYGNPTYGINFCQNCGADMRGGKDEAN